MRRCGWLPVANQTQSDPARIVWAKGPAATEECPTSYIHPQSIAWLERFFAWKIGKGELCDVAAKDVDALLLIQKEWQGLQNGLQ